MLFPGIQPVDQQRCWRHRQLLGLALPPLVCDVDKQVSTCPAVLNAYLWGSSGAQVEGLGHWTTRGAKQDSSPRRRRAESQGRRRLSSTFCSNPGWLGAD